MWASPSGADPPTPGSRVRSPGALSRSHPVLGPPSGCWSLEPASGDWNKARVNVLVNPGNGAWRPRRAGNRDKPCRRGKPRCDGCGRRWAGWRWRPAPARSLRRLMRTLRRRTFPPRRPKRRKLHALANPVRAAARLHRAVGRPAARGADGRTSSPSRTAGGSASRPGTATTRAIRRSTITPTSRGTGGTRSTRTCSRAITRSSASTPSWTLTADSLTTMDARAGADRDHAVREHGPAGRGLLRPPEPVLHHQNFSFSLDLFHGDAAFKPVDWRIKVTPVFNINNLNVNELGVVSPNVLKATERDRDLLRPAGVLRRDQAGRPEPRLRFRLAPARLAAVQQRLPRLPLQRHQPGGPPLRHPRRQPRPVQPGLLPPDGKGHQQRAEHVRQPPPEHGLSPTTTARTSSSPATRRRSASTYNHDEPSRSSTTRTTSWCGPTRSACSQPHEVDVVYLGWAGDGHIDRFNITHQFYWALGHDTLNPMANQPQDDQRPDVRHRSCPTTATGSASAPRSSAPRATTTSTTRHATGFDTILDDPNFAGGEFSYWQPPGDPAVRRQPASSGSAWCPTCVRARSRARANFVNPGLFLLNLGVDFELTPKLKLINNVNLLWFDTTNVARAVPLPGQHPPLHRHRPEHRARVPAAR